MPLPEHAYNMYTRSPLVNQSKIVSIIAAKNVKRKYLSRLCRLQTDNFRRQLLAPTSAVYERPTKFTLTSKRRHKFDLFISRKVCIRTNYGQISKGKVCVWQITRMATSEHVMCADL